MNSVAKKPFDLSAFDEFLANGWLLDLGPRGLAVGWGKWREFDSMQSECALFVPTFHPRTAQSQGARSWRMTENWDIIDRDFFASQVIAAAPRKVNADVQGFQWVEPRREAFDKAYSVIREGFRTRGLAKAVPVVFAHAQGTLSSAQRSKILQSLIRAPRSARLYGMWSDGTNNLDRDSEAGIIGATPEVLYERHFPAVVAGATLMSDQSVVANDCGKTGGSRLQEKSLVMTMALAGTRRKPSSTEEIELATSALLHDPKERHEHEIVVADISATLGAFGEIRKGETGIMELPTLLHLFTRIEAEVDTEIRLESLVSALHPTPALGVAPRSLGFDEIRKWDDENERGRFGAPFGVRFTDETETSETVLVAIRNLEWHGEQLRIGSGCGVVPMSDVEREWQELALKRSAVRGMLGL